MILGVCGSPRNKATEYVLKKSLKEIERLGQKTDFFTVRNKKIEFCKHCDYCLQNKKCVIEDDMIILSSLFSKAQGIIIASPVYYGGISAQTKALMDRCRALVAADKHFFKDKIGMAIAVGGDRIGGQELAIQQIISFYIINGVIPVSGGFFGANLGATFWSKDTLKGIIEDTEGYVSLKKTINEFVRHLKLK
jgi:multimeric flavodoxin WrbA